MKNPSLKIDLRSVINSWLKPLNSFPGKDKLVRLQQSVSTKYIPASQQLLDGMGDNSWAHDFKTGKTSFSENIYHLLGYDISKHPDKVSFWWNIVEPADIHLLQKNDIGYKNGTQQSHSVEYRVRDNDGQIKWILDRGVIVEKTAAGKPLRIVGSHTDITTRKIYELKLAESEQRFRDLVSNVPGVVYQWVEDLQGVSAFTYVSPKMKEVFDIHPEHMHTIIDMVHPDDRTAWQESANATRVSGNPWYFEGRLLYPNGQIKWFRGQAIYSANDERGMLYNGIMTDITEEVTLRNALAQKEKEGRQQLLKAVITAQEKEREAISYELHENVSQALAGVNLTMDIVKVEDERSKEYMDDCRSTIRSVMQELQTISRNVNNSVLTYLGFKGALQYLINQAHISSTVQCKLYINATINKENVSNEMELAIFRIVQTQLNNIVHHSKASSASIDISLEPKSVLLTIKDNGIGLQQPNEPKGLGLMTIASRAELFNGQVDVETTVGQGYTLCVRLPRIV